ncbi:MAG: VanW family protein [Clostridia bacterium]
MNEIKDETKEKENNAVQTIDQKENNAVQTIDQKEIEQENKELDFPKNNNIKIDLILILIAIIVITLALCSTMFAVINRKSSKIVKGVSISNIDVSNLTKEEAIKKLEEVYGFKSEKKIYLSYGEFDSSITYEALEVRYQIENAIKQAYDVGREGNIFQENFEILKTWYKNININIEVTIDNDMINQIAQNINNSIDGAVVQPSYYVENDNSKLIITSGKEGVKVDEKKLLEEIYKVLDENTDDEQKIEIPVVQDIPEKINIEKIHDEIYKEVKDAYYTKDPFTIHPEENGIDFDVEAAKAMLQEEKPEYEIALKITKPKKTVKDIGTEAFPDLLATFSTNYQASNVSRTTNLKLASNKINGTVILPNEEFSYNKVVGERTISAGYKMAATYSNGQVVDGLGGGICQISSTLYDAVVMANLNVTTRRNHQFVTSYVPAGKDATVVWGAQDFKFVNSRKYPVRIVATVEGGVATVQIWGIKEEVEYNISIETKKVATIEYTTQYVQDASLPVGQQKVIQAGNNGRKVEAYKVTKLNGQVVSTTLLSRDTYNAMKRIVHVGAGQ